MRDFPKGELGGGESRIGGGETRIGGGESRIGVGFSELGVGFGEIGVGFNELGVGDFPSVLNRAIFPADYVPTHMEHAPCFILVMSRDFW